MPRTFARLATTLASSLMLLALTALPALAAAGTKPDPVADPYLIGSLGELGLAAAVGIGIGILGYILLGKAPKADDDAQH